MLGALVAQGFIPRPAVEAATAAAPAVDGKPRILLIGDSISGGYAGAVAKAMAAQAEVCTTGDNCRETRYGLKNLDTWLNGRNWNVIHFNFGLWDLRPAKDKGTMTVPLEEYMRNLDTLVTRLAATGAVLVWASTTPVPEKNGFNRREADVRAYNAAALEVMMKHGVRINDLHAAILPRQAELQQPDDVHFTKDGSQTLAVAVTTALQAALAAQTPRRSDR